MGKLVDLITFANFGTEKYDDTIRYKSLTWTEKLNVVSVI